MKRSLIAGMAMATLTSAVLAQPYYVRGDFNGWNNNTDPMVQTDTNRWEYTVTGLTPGEIYEFKATVDDWSSTAPGSNAKYTADANGELQINLFDTETHADGWMPEGKWRLGYADNGSFDWELMGDMNGWGGGSEWFLDDMGEGLHSGTFSIAAGTYQFKFRSQNNWDFSIGDDFGNAAGNNEIILAEDTLVQFDIDMSNGRWRTTIIPAPGSAALLGLAGLVATRRRRG
ncbi:hypothetical protein MNBD_PLANCTO03-1476 [hydrothermal vent metagenome]|uniref:Glycoside hydrolase family 13 N-terminal domain-containing protein n=1 Tax=hydrothermal vent metagenome TaxID=652676 RepID=A0A3B1E0U3_9ZZZZ